MRASLSRILVVSVLSLTMCGCASYLARFSPPVAQTTEVKFKENDFQYVQTNLSGEAQVWFLLYGIPLGDVRLFSRALGDMYACAEGKVLGRACQLVNWTVDETDFNCFLLRRRKVVMRSDLIEYVK